MSSLAAFSGPTAAALVPIVALIVELSVDYLVYNDAKTLRDKGTPVTLRLGIFSIETPGAWLIGCLFFWIIFVPLYLFTRRRNESGGSG